MHKPIFNNFSHVIQFSNFNKVIIRIWIEALSVIHIVIYSILLNYLDFCYDIRFDIFKTKNNHQFKQKNIKSRAKYKMIRFSNYDMNIL